MVSIHGASRALDRLLLLATIFVFIKVYPLFSCLVRVVIVDALPRAEARSPTTNKREKDGKIMARDLCARVEKKREL